MGADREAQGVRREVERLATAREQPTADDSLEAHQNLAAALEELENRPGVDCIAEVAEIERKWAGVPMASVEAILLKLAREERKRAPAPKRAATRRRPGGDRPVAGQPGASSDVVGSPTERAVNLRIELPDESEPARGDLPHPDKPVAWPGGVPHPQATYAEPPEPGVLWQGGKALPMDTRGRPLPPKPSPSRGT